MVFITKNATEMDKEVECNLDVGVKCDDKGSDILGMNQLADVGAKIRWDPTAQDGDIYD